MMSPKNKNERIEKYDRSFIKFSSMEAIIEACYIIAYELGYDKGKREFLNLICEHLKHLQDLNADPASPEEPMQNKI